MELIILFLLFTVLPLGGYFVFRSLRKNVNRSTAIAEFAMIMLFIIALLAFVISWGMNSGDYREAIDPVDNGYTPFSQKYVGTLVVFFLLSVVSGIMLWLRGRDLPPLSLVLALVFLILGIPISVAVVIQVSGGEGQSRGGLFIPLPVMYIVIAVLLLSKIVLEDASRAASRTYRSRWLERINLLLANTRTQPLWVLLLLVPVFVIIVCILALFGQDTNAIINAFTDTATWRFSQQTHPPYLDHRGHYLCTVAACGDPEVVRPLRLGYRHGHEIIVNRQLQIANAFEQLIEEKMPVLHRFIRKRYDKYGYPLSQKITTRSSSNMVYRLMKPLEYFFLVVLYTCCVRPEERIARQYL